MKTNLFCYVVIVMLLGVNFAQAQISFSYFSGTPFHDLERGSIAFSDVDLDGDPDVLITGEDEGQYFSNLYINNGSGVFSLDPISSFLQGVSYSSIAFSDVDLDGDPDLFITGIYSYGTIQTVADFYINDGFGVFTPSGGFYPVNDGSIAFSDVDMDGDPDMLMTGLNYNALVANLFLNDGTGSFSLVLNSSFEGVIGSSIAFSDVDLDGDPDVLITGKNDVGDGIAKLYINDGMGNFSLVVGTPFQGVKKGSIAFSDVDLDGDPDVLITGFGNSSFVSDLYINDGLGNFTLASGMPFDGVWESAVAFADVDIDGDPDVLITGANSGGHIIAKLYSNDGMGHFELVDDMPFDGVWRGSVAFSDVDLDGDPDVLITGKNSNGQRIAKLYLNTILPSGLPNLQEKSASNVFPNPTDGLLPLNEKGIVEVQVYNIKGHLLLSKESVRQIDLTHFSSGIYFVVMRTEGAGLFSAMVVKR